MKYIDDPSVPIPKSTRYDLLNRSKQSLQFSSSSPLPIASLFSGDNFLQREQSSPEITTGENTVHNVKEFELITAHQAAINLHENTEVSDGIESTLTQENYADEIFEEIGSPVSEENTEARIAGIDDKAGLSTDSESDNDVDFSSSESSDEIEDSDTDDQQSPDLADESQTDSSQEKTFPAQQYASMAILSLIARHCMTTEAAKDIIDLLKVLCPENDTLQSLNYTNVQQVCGNCELYIYDICERCLTLFPTEREDQVNCSTLGCNGYVHVCVHVIIYAVC